MLFFFPDTFCLSLLLYLTLQLFYLRGRRIGKMILLTASKKAGNQARVAQAEDPSNL